MRPDQSKKKQAAQKPRNDNRDRVRKPQKPRKPQKHQKSQTWHPRLRAPVGDDERKEMYNSLKHSLQHDADKSDQLLRMLQSIQPAIWRRISNNEPFEPTDLSDEAVTSIQQIVSERDTAEDVDIVVPQKKITRKMMDFNDAYICQLPAARFEELQGILRSAVPRLALMDQDMARRVDPSSLPENVQLMVHQYLEKHLPDEVLANYWYEEDSSVEYEFDHPDDDDANGYEGDAEDDNDIVEDDNDVTEDDDEDITMSMFATDDEDDAAMKDKDVDMDMGFEVPIRLSNEESDWSEEL